MALQIYAPTQDIQGVNIGQARVQNPSLNLSYAKSNAEQAKLLWKGIGDLTQGGLKAGLTWLQQDRAANVLEQTNAFNRELNLFQVEYKKNKQGKDALGAGVDFDNFAQATMQRYMDEGDFDAAEQSMFTRSTSSVATSFMNQGYSYAAEQEGAWKTSVAKGTLAELDQFVALNYKNTSLVERQKELVKEELAAIYPGLDMTAQNASIDQEVIMNQIGSFVADKNFGAAESLLQNNRGLLGDKADEVTYRLAAQRESQMRLALAQQARADRQAAAALEERKHEYQRSIIDAVEDGDVDKANALIQEGRNLFSGTEYATAIKWTKPTDGGIASVAADKAQKTVSTLLMPDYGNNITVEKILQAEKTIKENWDILTPEQLNSMQTKLGNAIGDLEDTAHNAIYKEVLFTAMGGKEEEAIQLLEKKQALLPPDKYSEIHKSLSSNLQAKRSIAQGKRTTDANNVYKETLSLITPPLGAKPTMQQILEASVFMEDSSENLTGDQYASLRGHLLKAIDDVEDTAQNNLIKDIMHEINSGDPDLAWDKLEDAKGLLTHQQFSTAKGYIDTVLKERKTVRDEVVSIRNDATLKQITYLTHSTATGPQKVTDIIDAQLLLNASMTDLSAEQYSTASRQLKEASNLLLREEGQQYQKEVISATYNGDYTEASKKLEEHKDQMSAEEYNKLSSLIDSQKKTQTKAEEAKAKDESHRVITDLVRGGAYNVAASALQQDRKLYSGDEYKKITDLIYGEVAQKDISDAMSNEDWTLVETIAEKNRMSIPTSLYNSIVSGDLKRERNEITKKEKQDELLKQLTETLGVGNRQLAGNLLTTGRDTLSASEYSTWFNKINATEPATKDDMIAVRTLITMREANVPKQEVEAQAQTYYMQGQLTKASLDEYSGAIQTTPEQALAYTEAQNLISAFLGSDYNPATAETKVNLLTDLYTYRSANPEAAPDDIRNYGQALVSNYSIVDRNANPAMAPLPMYMNRKALLDRNTDAYRDSQKKLIKAYKDGRITAEFYAAEMKKYRNLERFFKQP